MGGEKKRRQYEGSFSKSETPTSKKWYVERKLGELLRPGKREDGVTLQTEEERSGKRGDTGRSKPGVGARKEGSQVVDQPKNTHPPAKVQSCQKEKKIVNILCGTGLHGVLRILIIPASHKFPPPRKTKDWEQGSGVGHWIARKEVGKLYIED